MIKDKDNGTAKGVARAALTAALHPLVAMPGYWLATGLAAIWGTALGGRVRRRDGLIVVDGLPDWAFGRGGTTIGGVYLTNRLTGQDVLEHEAVHREQWKRFGLAFVPLYLAAGQDPLRNRFEVEAGLELGGYVPKRKADAPPARS